MKVSASAIGNASHMPSICKNCGSMNSRGIKNRAALDAKISVLKQSYKLTGVKAPSNDEIFNEAVQLLYKDKIITKELKPITNKLKIRASQTVGRASTKTPSQSPIEIARQKNLEFDKEKLAS